MSKSQLESRKTKIDKVTDALRDEYVRKSSDAERLINFVKEQLNAAISAENIAVGFPTSSRVKSLQSIAEKIDRKRRPVKSVSEIDDLAGIRVVLLFKRDVEFIENFIQSTFVVISSENTASRLDESSFGYQSSHYVISLPSEWAKIPSLAGLDGMRAEIQVRTIAQHMWAAVSHKLQYKVEDSVPLEIRRAINRSSAVLEVVDLEFDRVLLERESYISQITGTNPDKSLILNVDLLQEISNRLMPERGGDNVDGYAILLQELISLGINSVGKLEDLIFSNMDKAISEDGLYLMDEDNENLTSPELWNNGCYFSHVGMIRNMLRYKFGDKADEVIK